MSALGLIFAFIGFAISPIGLFALLFGILLFILLPAIPLATNHFHAFARLHLWLGTRLLKRAAFVVTKQGDLLLKRMSPDDAGTELIEFEDTTKEFEDPTSALHWWKGIPFAIADEVHGVLFDPRHAAAAQREKTIRDRDEDHVPASRTEQDQHEVIGWQHAVYEFPRDVYDIVNLGAIRHIIQGSERAEHPQRVKQFYEYSRQPYGSGGSTAQYILIIVAVLAPFIGTWIMSSQLSTPDSSVSFGLAVLLASLGTAVDRDDLLATLKRAGVVLAVLLPLPIIYLLLFVFVSPVLATFIFLLLGAGFWLVPVLCLLGRASAGFADLASGFLFRLGFMGWDRPIFTWTPEGYQVRELRNLSDIDESTAAWYGFAGNMVGFSFEPGPDSWARGVVANSDLENRQSKPTDPGTHIPSDLAIWEGQTRATYGAMVPREIRDACYYVSSGLLLEDFTFAATGSKSNERLTQAKDQYGESGPIPQGRFALTLLFGSLVSLAMGVFLFVL